jgi:pimeloyl-ACP methyl ester carboxylesterase
VNRAQKDSIHGFPRGDLAMVRRLEAAPVNLDDGTSDAWLRLRDRAMHRLGVGSTRRMRSVITGVAIPIWRCRTTTLREKADIWRGLSLSRRFLWDDLLQTDLAAQVDGLGLPVYFLVRAHDFTANHELARDYFARRSAPVKGFHTFHDSAHSPLFEERLYAREVLSRDVLTGGAEFAER